MNSAAIFKMVLCVLAMLSPCAHGENIIRSNAPITLKKTHAPDFYFIDVTGSFNEHSIASSQGVVDTSFNYAEEGNTIKISFDSGLPITLSYVEVVDNSGSGAEIVAVIEEQSCTGSQNSYSCLIALKVDATQSGCDTLAECKMSGGDFMYSFTGKAKMYY